MIVRSFLPLFSLMLLLFSQPGFGAVNSEQIKASVDQFLTAHISKLSPNYGDDVRIEYHIRAIDPRLAMADCPQPLDTQIKSQKTIGRISVKVSCPKGRIWSLYVPADINLYRPIVTTISPVAKGDLLSADQLKLREVNVSQLNGRYFTDLNEVVGLQAKRQLRADKAVTSSYLEQPLMIKKGESVIITAKSAGLVVKIPGVALRNGHKGQQISVRNAQSKRIVDAKVIAPGQVSIPM